MATPIRFDEATGRQFLKYARLLCARGYVHNTLGNTPPSTCMTTP